MVAVGDEAGVMRRCPEACAVADYSWAFFCSVGCKWEGGENGLASQALLGMYDTCCGSRKCLGRRTGDAGVFGASDSCLLRTVAVRAVLPLARCESVAPGRAVTTGRM